MTQTFSTLLTWRESRVFRFLQLYIEQYGYPPSMKEIGEAADLVSSSSVAHALNRIELKGYISRTRGQNRSITITPAQAHTITVSRDDVADVLKLLGTEIFDVDSPVGRLAAAAGLT